MKIAFNIKTIKSIEPKHLGQVELGGGLDSNSSISVITCQNETRYYTLWYNQNSIHS